MNKKRIVSTVMVSFICILLASSFVLETSAAAYDSAYSLENVTYTNGRYEAGFVADEKDIVDLRVNETALKSQTVRIGKYSSLSFSTGLSGSYNTIASSRCYDSIYDFVVVYQKSGGVNGWNYYVFAFDGSSKVSLGYFSLKTGTIFAVTIIGSYLYAVCGSSLYRVDIVDSALSDPVILEDVKFDLGFGSYCFCSYSSPYLFIAGKGSSYSFVFVRVNLDTFEVESTGFDYGNSMFVPVLNNGYIFYRGAWQPNGGGWWYDVKNLERHEYSGSFYLTGSVSSCVINEFAFFFGDSCYMQRGISSDLLSLGSYGASTSHDAFSSGDSAFVFTGWNVSSMTFYRVDFAFSGSEQLTSLVDYATFTPDRYINFDYTGSAPNWSGFQCSFGFSSGTLQNCTGFSFQFVTYTHLNAGESEVLPVSVSGVDALYSTDYTQIDLDSGMTVYVGNCEVYLRDSDISNLEITIYCYLRQLGDVTGYSLPVSQLTLEYWEDEEGYLTSIDGKLDVIQSSLDGTNETLGRIEDILTSVPDGYSDTMSHYNGILSDAQKEESAVISYAESFFQDPSFDESLALGISQGGAILDEMQSGDSAELWDFFRYLWTVHPQMLIMAGIVVTFSCTMLVIRMS